jgi:sRNA-binding regulator protein Hfq
MPERQGGRSTAGVRRMRKPKADASVKARGDELVASGMPYQMAMAVAHGRMELNEALERMARKDKVNALMERHTLSRALATQIALGHADLDVVLARRRLETHRSTHRDRTCLVEGARLALVLHDGRTLKGTVAEVTPYQVVFQPDEGPPETFHKLLVMYAYAPEDWKSVKKGVKLDKRNAAVGAVAPAERPQDRYSCSDKRLFGYLDKGTDVVVTLLDGETLRGTIQWFGRYEFGLKLRTDVGVTVFRHSLKDASPANG